MAEYSIPKKEPYTIVIKAGHTVSTTLKETSIKRKNVIRTSAKKFEMKNIRKGWTK